MVPYGGFWWRVLAYIIDWVILQIASSFVSQLFGFGLVLPFAGVGIDNFTTIWAMALGTFGAIFALNWLYFAVMESSKLQATVGKLAIGLVVTDMRGDRLTFARATGRFFAKILSFMLLCIGYVMVAFMPRKQGLHDLIASTLVYKTRDPSALFDNREVFA